MQSTSTTSGRQGSTGQLVAPPPLSPLALAILASDARGNLHAALDNFINSKRARIPELWQAAKQILEIHPADKPHIAWTIANKIVDACQALQPIDCRKLQPPIEVAARFWINYATTLRTLNFFKNNFSIEPLEVFLDPAAQREVSHEIIENYIDRQFEPIIEDPSKRQLLIANYRATALRQDIFGLRMCARIRDLLDKTPVKSERYQLLWDLRDGLTKELCDPKFRSACERNLKLALLFPRTVPHPCIDFDSRPVMESDKWLFQHANILRLHYGDKYGDEIVKKLKNGTLLSNNLIPLVQSHISSIFRGTGDPNEEQLLLLKKYLGLGNEGQIPSTLDMDPRSWVSESDRIRFQAASVLTAFEIISNRLWQRRCSVGAQDTLRALMRRVIREHPIVVAEAAYGTRRNLPHFFRALSELVREEVMNAAVPPQGAPIDSKQVTNALIVAEGFGWINRHFTRVAVRELESILPRFTAQNLIYGNGAELLAASRILLSTTPTIESEAIRLIKSAPDTPGASFLARYLFEVRCPDSSVGDLIRQQAKRRDLPARIWMNYAVAAIGLGLEADEQRKIEIAFKDCYEASVKEFSSWCYRSRSSLRLIRGALIPSLIQDLTVFEGDPASSFHSDLENRIIGFINKISGIKVIHTHYIPRAPEIDGILVIDGGAHPPIVIMIDGESFHAVNDNWAFRGLDGHSLLGTRIITGGGYAVVRIPAPFGESGNESKLKAAIEAVVEYVKNGTDPQHSNVIVDPPPNDTAIRDKLLLFNRQGTAVRTLPKELASD